MNETPKKILRIPLGHPQNEFLSVLQRRKKKAINLVEEEALITFNNISHGPIFRPLIEI